MTEKEKKIYVRWLGEAHKIIRKLCKKDKELDPNAMLQTLFLLQMSPAKRLNWSLLRAGKIKPF